MFSQQLKALLNTKLKIKLFSIYLEKQYGVMERMNIGTTKFKSQLLYFFGFEILNKLLNLNLSFLIYRREITSGRVVVCHM